MIEQNTRNHLHEASNKQTVFVDIRVVENGVVVVVVVLVVVVVVVVVVVEVVVVVFVVVAAGVVVLAVLVVVLARFVVTGLISLHRFSRKHFKIHWGPFLNHSCLLFAGIGRHACQHSAYFSFQAH